MSHEKFFSIKLPTEKNLFLVSSSEMSRRKFFFLFSPKNFLLEKFFSRRLSKNVSLKYFSNLLSKNYPLKKQRHKDTCLKEYSIPIDTCNFRYLASPNDCGSVSQTRQVLSTNTIPYARGSSRKASPNASAEPMNVEEAKLMRIVRDQFNRKRGFVRIFPAADTWTKYSKYLGTVARLLLGAGK